MIKKNAFKNYGIISLTMYILCIVVYFIMQNQLTPDLPELTPILNGLSIFIIAAFIITGIYHIFLLINSLRNLQGRFIFSVYIALVIISGITLLSDAALLSDIGKEYLVFDVSGEWTTLFCFSGFHLAVMITGTLLLVNKDFLQKIFTPAGDNEKLFLTIHHIGLFTGVLGIICTLLVNWFNLVPMKYQDIFQLLVAVLILAPVVLFSIFWVLKLRKKAVNEWLDEMQVRDGAFGAVLGLISAVPIYAMAVITESMKQPGPGIIFWVIILVFIQISVYSSTVLLRRR